MDKTLLTYVVLEKNSQGEISQSHACWCPGPCQMVKLYHSSHKSHNALDKYLTIFHFLTEMCTFWLQNGALWDMGLVHCGICATGLRVVGSVSLQSVQCNAFFMRKDTTPFLCREMIIKCRLSVFLVFLNKFSTTRVKTLIENGPQFCNLVASWNKLVVTMESGEQWRWYLP